MGGSVGAGLGRSQDRGAHSLLGEIFCELQIGDIMALGIVAGAKTLPTLPVPIGERMLDLRVRIRFRVPLMRPSNRTSVLPILTFGGDGGGGFVGGTGAIDDAAATFGVHAGLELVTRTRVSPFISVGFRRSFLLEEGPGFRQGELQVGATVLLGGRRNFEPRPAAQDRSDEDAVTPEPEREPSTVETLEERARRYLRDHDDEGDHED